MQRLILILLGILTAGSMYGQSLKKYAIGNSGCSVYAFCDPAPFNLEKSPDSSDVYTGECSVGDVAYGVICVKIKEQINNMMAGEETLVSYLDYLKTSLNIASSVGYGKGHRLKNKENTRGVIDYWKDKDGINWKIKGWTDGKYIAVLYVCSKNEVPETKANVFLDGLILPGM